MNFSIQGWKGRALGLLAAAVLVACGGGDDNPPAVASVRTFGDSLADVGTFAIAGTPRFTIQGPNSKVYPELVGAAYNLSATCNFFVFTGTTFAPNPTANCSNYAIGGSRINGGSNGTAAADPRNIGVQLDTATAGGNFKASDLLLIDGGGNDAADLVGAFLAAQQGAPAGYLGILGQLLSAADVTQATKSASDLGAAGGLYMVALADRMTDLVRTKALAKGAERVAILNAPAITLTPRFQMVLGGVEAAKGKATRLQLEGLFNLWVDSFNARLKNNFNGDSRVTVIDANAAFVAWVANPSAYGLTDAKRAACPVTGVGSDGLPTYSFATCTEAALSASTPPAGATGATWYQSWLFSDGFHPSQKGHLLLADVITTQLKAAGWL
ncbi:MAG TPA: SGNH/GDSL hydrolase family protein [Burkholderiaceae bacterium]|nr:SGNH/GDSL hydrolase family protein [Burkholderiaceae bacterium]